MIQKVKSLCINWNSVQSLIRISRIWWWCLLFLLLTISTILGQIWSKNWKLFEVKFDNYTNLNYQNSMVVLILSVLDCKYPFWINLVQEIKTVSLSWNLVLRIIRIWRIQSWCSLSFFFLTGSIFLVENLIQKIKIVSWSWNLEPILIQICRTRWGCPFFLVRKYPFGVNLVGKLKNSKICKIRCWHSLFQC